jgi:hypothetical protein
VVANGPISAADWINWRRYLNEFAPMLFKGGARATS